MENVPLPQEAFCVTAEGSTGEREHAAAAQDFAQKVTRRKPLQRFHDIGSAVTITSSCLPKAPRD
ncbi:hypothetical protein [Streptomyces sp. NPDC088246]|uniref:hypothetical protein n=1 Tax=Streptomyces sp. NPDC088246 TaxID=3365842 RepID=UPI003805A849